MPPTRFAKTPADMDLLVILIIRDGNRLRVRLAEGLERPVRSLLRLRAGQCLARAPRQ